MSSADPWRRGPAPMTLIEALAEIRPGSSLAEALGARADILRLSQESHDAVLLPEQAGGLSHGLRAALAARVARQNAQPSLAAHYDELRNRSGETDHSETSRAEQACIAVI